MAGKYSITEDRSDAYKFRCMVSFNDKKAEYYEVDSFDSATIDATLQKAADDDVERMAQVLEVETPDIVDGKIVVVEAVE